MRIALVEWNDANQLFGWDNKKSHREHKLSPCYTVGIVVNDEVDRIVVVQTGNPESFGNSVTIDRKCIKRIRYLEIKGER